MLGTGLGVDRVGADAAELDREEIGNRARIPAKAQLEKEIGITLHSIVSLTDFVEHLEEQDEFAAQLPAMKAYRNRYGVALDN